MDFSKMTAYQLYQYGVDNPKTPHAVELTEALIGTGFTDAIFNAGWDWSDDLYSERIFEALIDCNDVDYLPRIIVKWKSERYCCKKIFHTLIKKGTSDDIYNINDFLLDEYYDDEALDVAVKRNDYKVLYAMGRCWPIDRYSEKIMDALLLSLSFSSDAEAGVTCCNIGSYWPDEKFDGSSEKIIDKIVDTKNTRWIWQAGCRWPEYRFKKVAEKLSKELLKTKDVNYIKMAICDWPLFCSDKDLLDFAVDNGTWEDLNEILFWGNQKIGFDDKIMEKMIEKAEEADVNPSIFTAFESGTTNGIARMWPNSKFSSYFAKRLFEQNDAECLYFMGMSWSSFNFVPDIGYYLYLTKDDKYIELAKKNWSDDRVKYIGRRRIVVSY